MPGGVTTKALTTKELMSWTQLTEPRRAMLPDTLRWVSLLLSLAARLPLPTRGCSDPQLPSSIDYLSKVLPLRICHAPNIGVALFPTSSGYTCPSETDDPPAPDCCRLTCLSSATALRYLSFSTMQYFSLSSLIKQRISNASAVGPLYSISLLISVPNVSRAYPLHDAIHDSSSICRPPASLRTVFLDPFMRTQIIKHISPHDKHALSNEKLRIHRTCSFKSSKFPNSVLRQKFPVYGPA